MKKIFESCLPIAEISLMHVVLSITGKSTYSYQLWFTRLNVTFIQDLLGKNMKPNEYHKKWTAFSSSAGTSLLLRFYTILKITKHKLLLYSNYIIFTTLKWPFMVKYLFLLKSYFWPGVTNTVLGVITAKWHFYERLLTQRCWARFSIMGFLTFWLLLMIDKTFIVTHAVPSFGVLSFFSCVLR